MLAHILRSNPVDCVMLIRSFILVFTWRRAHGTIWHIVNKPVVEDNNNTSADWRRATHSLLSAADSWILGFIWCSVHNRLLFSFILLINLAVNTRAEYQVSPPATTFDHSNILTTVQQAADGGCMQIVAGAGYGHMGRGCGQLRSWSLISYDQWMVSGDLLLPARPSDAKFPCRDLWTSKWCDESHQISPSLVTITKWPDALNWTQIYSRWWWQWWAQDRKFFNYILN